MNILSRHHEFEADTFAVSLGFKTELAKSLIKIQVQNLSTIDPLRIFSVRTKPLFN